MKHAVFMADVHISSYANLVLLHRVYNKLETRCWNKSRKAFLQKELREKGKLECHYCHKPDLKLKSSRRCEQATVDHVVAKSTGGAACDHSNFVVCCNTCNQRKAAQSAFDFLNSKYIQRKKQTLENL